MRALRDWTVGNRAALVLFLASCGVGAVVALRAAGIRPAGEPSAARPDEIPAAAVESPADPGAVGPDPVVLNGRVRETVSRNPFRPERARAAGRYRLPGTEAPAVPDAAPVFEAPPPPPMRPPLPDFRLVGTVSLEGGRGLAAIQVSGAPPRVVNVGDSLAGFRLESVTPTEARLRGQDTTLVIRSSSPVP